MASVLRYWMSRPRPLPRWCSASPPRVSRYGLRRPAQLVGQADCGGGGQRADEQGGGHARAPGRRALISRGARVATSAVPPASQAPRLRDSTSAIATASSATTLRIRAAPRRPPPGREQQQRQRGHADMSHVVAVPLCAARTGARHGHGREQAVGLEQDRAGSDDGGGADRDEQRAPVPGLGHAPRGQERRHAAGRHRERAPGQGLVVGKREPRRAGDEEAGQGRATAVMRTGPGASSASTAAQSGAMATSSSLGSAKRS